MTALCIETENHPDMAITAAVLEERVNGHIKFVWTLMGVGFAWLTGISIFLFHMNGTLSRVEITQADAPSKIVAAILNKSQGSRSEVAGGLAAAATSEK